MLTVRVVDHGGLFAEAVVTVRVLNVNDVVVSGFGDTVGLSTLGGDVVVLLGSSFGPVDEMSPVTFNVSYGPGTGTAFPAVGCERVTGYGNSRLQCTTTPGFGVGLRWRVSVTFPGVNGDVVVSNATMAYLPPVITAVSSSAVDMKTTVGLHFVDVCGGLRGTMGGGCGCLR
jgi:hypothetical protein